LRKWQLKSKDIVEGRPQGIVIGYMHDDIHDIWEDGEYAEIHYVDWVESVHFYLAVTRHGCIKLPKDEERTNALKKFNGTHLPEKD